MKLRLVGLSGSLRRESFNTALLREFARRLPDDAQLELHDYAELPHYNQDVDVDPPPPAVERLRQAIAAADGVVFATPEYNFSVPGVLKNAIDWASRPAFKAPLNHKPAGLLSASKSAVGGARSQVALRQVLSGTLTPVFPQNEILVPAAHEKFNAQGVLADAQTEQRLQRYVTAFVAWVRRQRN